MSSLYRYHSFGSTLISQPVSEDKFDYIYYNNYLILFNEWQSYVNKKYWVITGANNSL